MKPYTSCWDHLVSGEVGEGSSAAPLNCRKAPCSILSPELGLAWAGAQVSGKIPGDVGFPLLGTFLRPLTALSHSKTWNQSWSYPSQIESWRILSPTLDPIE